MKILITTEWWNPTVNGVVTSVNSLKDALEKLDMEVRVLTVSPTFESYYIDGVYYLASIPVNSIYKGARVTLRRKSSFLKNIIEWNPDIIHSQSEFSTFIYAKHISGKTGAPIVHTYHTDYERYSRYILRTKETSKTSKRLVRNFFKPILNNCSVIIAPSEKTKEQLESYRLKSLIEVVPTGINVEEFKKTANIEKDKKDFLKEQFSLPKNRTILLSISRLGEEKSVDTTLKNFAKLLQQEDFEKNNRPYLVIVGSGPEEHRLKKLSETLKIDDDVLWVGMVPPQMVKYYYATADIFVSSSTSETQGLTYMEAQSAGLPLLCRNDSVLKETLIPGLTGESFNDSVTFNKAYKNIQENINGMRTAAFLNSNRWTKERFGERIQEIYQKLLEQN